MQEVFSRHELISREELRLLSQRSDLAGSWRVLQHAVVVAATSGLVAQSIGSIWLFPAMVLQGLVLNFLFCALHEATHLTVFRTRSLNTALAVATGLIVNVPAFYFRHFHFAHHRHTQNGERDPELIGAGSGPANRWQYVQHLFALKRVWWAQVMVRVNHARGKVTENYIPGSGKRRVVLEARAVLAIYAGCAVVSVWFQSLHILWFWLLPLLLGRPFLSGFLMAEHTGCAPTSEDMVANTRTTLTNALVRFICWNMNYHVEHHLFPAIPFHRLAEAYARIQGRHLVVAGGYLPFHRELLRTMTR